MGLFDSKVEKNIKEFYKVQEKIAEAQSQTAQTQSQINKAQSKLNQKLNNSELNERFLKVSASSAIFIAKLKQLSSEIKIIRENSKFLFGFKDSKGSLVSFVDAINGLSEQDANDREKVQKLKNDLKEYTDSYKAYLGKIDDFSNFGKNCSSYIQYAKEALLDENYGKLNLIIENQNKIDEQNNEIENIINNIRKVCDKKCTDILRTFYRDFYGSFAVKTLNYLDTIGDYDGKDNDIKILEDSIKKFNNFNEAFNGKKIDQSSALFKFNEILAEVFESNKFFKVFIAENSICFQDPSKQRRITNLNSDYWKNLAAKATPQKQGNSNNSNINSAQSGNSKIPTSQFKTTTGTPIDPQFKPTTNTTTPTQQSKSSPANDNSKESTPEQKIKKIEYLQALNALLKRYIPKTNNVIKEVNEQVLIHKFLKNLLKKGESDLISELDKFVNARKEIVEDFNQSKNKNTNEKNIESLDKLINSDFCVLKKVLEILKSNLTMIEEKLENNSQYEEQYKFFKERKNIYNNSCEKEARDFYDKTVVYCKLIENKLNLLNELVNENVFGIKDHLSSNVNQEFTYTSSNNAGQRDAATKF